MGERVGWRCGNGVDNASLVWEYVESVEKTLYQSDTESEDDAR